MSLAVQLEKEERIIERGQRTFIEVGNALARIRDQGLYKAAAFDTFERYCSERWGFQRAHAYRLMEAAGVVTEVSPMGDTPVNERQARALAAVPTEERAQVWEEVQQVAADREVPVTARLIKEVANGNEDRSEEAPEYHRAKCSHGCEVHCPSHW